MIPDGISTAIIKSYIILWIWKFVENTANKRLADFLDPKHRSRYRLKSSSALHTRSPSQWSAKHWVTLKPDMARWNRNSFPLVFFCKPVGDQLSFLHFKPECTLPPSYGCSLVLVPFLRTYWPKWTTSDLREEIKAQGSHHFPLQPKSIVTGEERNCNSWRAKPDRNRLGLESFQWICQKKARKWAGEELFRDSMLDTEKRGSVQSEKDIKTRRGRNTNPPLLTKLRLVTLHYKW